VGEIDGGSGKGSAAGRWLMADGRPLF
jgi:hypothetical protein